MNKYLIALILIILCTLLTGCWNYRELNSIYIVAGRRRKAPLGSHRLLATECLAQLRVRVQAPVREPA